ncbi:hypothetical protein C8J57DRAFT_1518352 [Mycena rebaudengoi]|nr:hypothetical protein C8J57DRAFT_1518352 [Mycena rebaudengoi]
MFHCLDKRNRRIVLHVKPAFHFTGLIFNLNVDDAIIKSREVVELHDAVVEVGWLLNDILSWNTEQRRGDFLNLVSLIMIHEKKTVQDAVDDVEQEVRTQHKDFKDLQSLIQTNDCWPWVAVHWSYVKFSSNDLDAEFDIFGADSKQE